MNSNRSIGDNESVDSLRHRIRELERWFQRQDRQLRFLERERQKLSALVNHTDAGFLVLDTKLAVRWSNTICRIWFGGKSSAGGTDTCNALLCGAASTCAECPVAAALDSGRVSHREMRLDLDERAHQIYATAMPIKAPDNRVDECILMLQDITDLEVLRRSQEALLVAKESAESANRAKSEFLANMSHEVRTPMTGILSMSSHLLESPLSAEQRECLDIIQSSGRALLTIINDILDFSRIEAGRLSIEPMPFDLSATVDEIVTLVSEKAEEKSIEFILRYSPEVPRRVVGDAGRIRQTLLNLVANAIKFTHEGHILVSIEKVGADEASVRVRFAVEDTGIGIPAEKLTSVFEKFTQADGSITRRYGGTGLGLAIAKQLVELMGGAIAVTSTEGSGSTFAFTLELPLDLEAPKASPGVALDGADVLIVHRHPIVRRVLVEQIASWGGKPQSVATATEALEALRNVSGGAAFSFVIVGHELDDMTPQTFASLLRGDTALAATYVVLLTASHRIADGSPSEGLGFDATFTRPVRASQLAAVFRAAKKTVAAP